MSMFCIQIEDAEGSGSQFQLKEPRKFILKKRLKDWRVEMVTFKHLKNHYLSRQISLILLFSF
jgi:hypothetical protein